VLNDPSSQLVVQVIVSKLCTKRANEWAVVDVFHHILGFEKNIAISSQDKIVTPAHASTVGQDIGKGSMIVQDGVCGIE
jgi:hypothetical protein